MLFLEPEHSGSHVAYLLPHSLAFALTPARVPPSPSHLPPHLCRLVPALLPPSHRLLLGEAERRCGGALLLLPCQGGRGGVFSEPELIPDPGGG